MSTENLQPRDAAEVGEAMRWALSGGKALELIGRGSKRAIGRAAQWDATLDLSGLSGVTLYEPEELVLSAKAGTPLAEIEALVAASGQELAFEPMDYGPLLGVAAGAGSIGGVLAANLSGPRRIKAGAARDHFLGVNAVSGRGETFKSGGRVVKNVTGYDLCKLIAGSWGTLAAMTDITIKTLPRAETEETILVIGLDDAAAGKAMAAAVGSFADVSAAAHLPAPVAARIAESASAHAAVTAFRLEGVPPSIAHRKDVLQKLAAPFGTLAALGEGPSRALWRSIRDVVPFAAATERRALCLAPFDGAVARRRGWPRPGRAGGGGCALRLGGRSDLGWPCRRRTMHRPRSFVPRSRRPAAMPRSSARRPRCVRRSRCSSPSRRGLRP